MHFTGCHDAAQRYHTKKQLKNAKKVFHNIRSMFATPRWLEMSGWVHIRIVAIILPNFFSCSSFIGQLFSRIATLYYWLVEKRGRAGASKKEGCNNK